MRRVGSWAVYAAATIRAIAEAYLLWAARFGLDARVLWAQALYETGGFRFGGEVAPAAFNLCGLRFPDGSEYYSFSTPVEGVIAHVAHLGCHVLPECPEQWRSQCVSDPKHPGQHWHDMRVVYDLETARMAWCSTSGYAAAVCRAWNLD